MNNPPVTQEMDLLPCPFCGHAPMIDAAEVERVRAEAERCKYKSGTLGVWARHYLALYEWAQDNAEIVARLEANG